VKNLTEHVFYDIFAYVIEIVYETFPEDFGRPTETSDFIVKHSKVLGFWRINHAPSTDIERSSAASRYTLLPQSSSSSA
jgi:hypothetical protein